MATKQKIKSETVTFGNKNYNCRTAPSAKPVESDPVDVTTLDDTEEQYLPGAITKNGDIVLTVNGITEAPTLNEVAALTINVTYNDGNQDDPETVDCGKCILTKIEPPNPEANGERAANWTLTFKPSGQPSGNQTP